jgi:geranylgeranyl diphosphate synthase type II
MSTRQDTFVKRDLWGYIAATRPEIEKSLRRHLPVSQADVNGHFNAALDSALFPGGKRIRPMLTLLGAEVVGGRRDDVLAAATAVEYLHNSSLIFDDLPCMDNASTRRGELPLHQRYGEGTAVLVALSLMNAAYGLILHNSATNAELAAQAHAELVECIGPNGMLGGQAIDLALTAGILQPNSQDGLESLRNRKTSALIRFSLRIGAISVGARPRQLQALSRFAELIGNAYQIRDDIIDHEEDALRAATGECSRTAGETEEGCSCHAVTSLIMQAKQTVEEEFGWDEASALLCGVADFVGQRTAHSKLGIYA